jgi:hypothetical protein
MSQNFISFAPKKQGLPETLMAQYGRGPGLLTKFAPSVLPKRGARVALHIAKSQPSYMQGIVKDWRRAERQRAYAEDQETKT